MSLKQKTISGLVWSFISQGGKQISQFAITAVLARLLSPSDFGLLGMITVFTGFISIFNDLGIGNALIQKQNADDRHLSSAFWLNLLTGFFLAAFFFFTAPAIARFYNKPELQPLLSVMSVNFILASFTIVQQSVLTKEMDFKSLMIRDLAATVIAGIVGIVLAYRGWGVWSLVYQFLAYTLINGIVLWTFSDWKPKFIFSMQAIKDVAGFSVHMTNASILNYLARNIDYLLIGKFLGAEALGFYTLAYKLMLYPLQNISWTVSRVMFPAFSKIQSDFEKIRTNYLKLIKCIALITFPMMTGLFAVADLLVEMVYGPKWAPAVILIQIFCFCGMAQSIGTTIGNIYQSQGKVKLQFQLQLTGTILTAICIILGLYWGTLGVALLYTIESVLWINVAFYFGSRVIQMNPKEIYFQLSRPFLLSFIMMAAVFILKVYGGIHNLFWLVLAGAVVYAMSLFLTKEVSLKKVNLS